MTEHVNVPHEIHKRKVDSYKVWTKLSSTAPRRPDDWRSTTAGLPASTIKDPGVGTGDSSISSEEIELDPDLEEKLAALRKQQAALRKQQAALREQEAALRGKLIAFRGQKAALRGKLIASRVKRRLRNIKKRAASQQYHPDEHKKDENNDDDGDGQQCGLKPAAKRHKEM
jgi:small-conductance mechanosensitive channel